MRACGPQWTSPSWKPACELAWSTTANLSERACSQEPFTHVPWSSRPLVSRIFEGPYVRSRLRENWTCRELRRLSRTPEDERVQGSHARRGLVPVNGLGGIVLGSQRRPKRVGLRRAASRIPRHDLKRRRLPGGVRAAWRDEVLRQVHREILRANREKASTRARSDGSAR